MVHSPSSSLKLLQRPRLHLGHGVSLRPPNSPSRRLSVAAASALVIPPTRRLYSSANEPPRFTQRPKPSFKQFVRHVVKASLRNLATSLSPRGISSAFRDAPVAMSLTLLLVIVAFTVCFVALRGFLSAFYGPNWSQFPDPVANTLRRAIYSTIINPDPERALRLYKKAMQQCEELNLDPFSDPVLGIRIYVAGWLETINNHKQAAHVLETVLDDCKRWIAVMEQSVADGKIDVNGRLVQTRAEPDFYTSPDSDATKTGKDSPQPQDAPVPTETFWGKRQRLLAKSIGISLKLGELYSDEHVMDPEKSRAHLVWAVETGLKEFQRRHAQGPKPGESSWLSPQELGASMESLAHDYESKSQFHLAIPLFFQALRLCDSPCHQAIIMNNLSVAFAQYPIFSPAKSEALSAKIDNLIEAPMVPTTRNECLASAENWAQNALRHARDVSGDQRTAECDEACAVALCNWADVAAMMGKTGLAQDKYREAIAMSNELGYDKGIKQAQEGLTRLTSSPEGQI